MQLPSLAQGVGKVDEHSPDLRLVLKPTHVQLSAFPAPGIAGSSAALYGHWLWPWLGSQKGLRDTQCCEQGGWWPASLI